MHTHIYTHCDTPTMYTHAQMQVVKGLINRPTLNLTDPFTHYQPGELEEQGQLR